MSSIIGLTRQEDGCVSGYDASFSQSDSGLFMNELQGMSLKILDSLDADPEIWIKMSNARENGINTFKTDIFSEILKYNEYTRQKFSGDIGRRQFNQVITKYPYHGMRMFSDVKGGIFTLRGITLNLNTTETVNLLIYDDFELLYTITIDSVAGKPKLNTITPIEFNLIGDLYFIFAPIGTPYNNKMTCGCGGYRWCFNRDRPCYKGSKDNWTLWAMIGGITGSDLNERDDWFVGQYAQGMRLHGDFRCDATNILCSESSDFVNNEVDRAMAFAILYKSAEYLTYDIMNSGEVSRWTLLGKDDVLNENMKYYQDRYVAMIDFIAQNIEPDRSECLRCKSQMKRMSHII